MMQHDRFREDMLDLEDPGAAGDIVYIAAPATFARVEGDVAVLTVPLVARKPSSFEADPSAAPLVVELHLQSFGGCMVRARMDFGVPGTAREDLDSSPMIERDDTLHSEQLFLLEGAGAGEYVIGDASGRVVLRTLPPRPPSHPWSRQLPDPDPVFDAVVSPDGAAEVPLMAHDTFFPAHRESIGLGCVLRGDRSRLSLFSLHARPGERFLGTGERFSRFGLAGSTIVLENTDALGVSSRRAYKNVPFYVSSAGYGLFVHTSYRTRLSFADVSSRAVQGAVESSTLDLFFIGGGSVRSIVRNYRRLTGVPRKPPLWSYGAWMARMTYFSAKEALDVAKGMRTGGFPCDVIHLDTGWFRTDWRCEWEFSPERFPDPAGFFREMKSLGFRVSLWQLPLVTEGTSLYSLAREKRYIAPGTMPPLESKFDDARGCTIDFTSPQAVEWYKGLLRKLLRMGAAAIKTDFGETIDMQASYHGMSAARLRNIYCLLYHRAAFEVTREVYPDGIIWARSGWAGSQRYPVPWGGDAACTWDGLAATIRGGLQIGLSGFAFWSHDVPGFHSLPSFMNDRPSDELFVRWTQVGVFTSHLRFHGSSAREPWEYPGVAGLVREWLKLRYALIPYLHREGEQAISSGLPVFRSLVFHHEEDPVAWTIEDEFYCGGAFLVAPVLNAGGTRSVYLPAGEWIDFWTGERIRGPVALGRVEVPLSRVPLFVRSGTTIPFYPEPVACTDEMDLTRTAEMVFDESYRGFRSSALAKHIEL